MSKKKKAVILTSVLAGVLALAVLIGLMLTGLYVGWGPFTFLQFDRQQKAILARYDCRTRGGEIVFYGASNFRLWTEMENDLSEYKVQNHGFGGSCDKDLVKRAGQLLFPYAPQIVFFQTGSNDYVSLKGTEEEKIAACMAYKEQMFAAFHEELPDACFVVMSGLLLPGRSEYTPLTQKINAELKTLCDSHDYMYFVDAEQMTFDGSAYRDDLFVSDGIHLNREGQALWCDTYIRPQIAAIIAERGLEGLTK